MSDHKNETYANFRSGYVAILGAPNVGKSTLLNRMLGQKISITSKKPQTTRNRIIGIVHRPDTQIVVIDTPGIHHARNILNVRIVEVALAVLKDADLVLFVIDAGNRDQASEEILISKLHNQPRPVLLVLNKIDLIGRAKLLQLISRWAQLFNFVDIVPVSAKLGHQVEDLVSAIARHLPSGPPFFPEDALTDVPEQFLVSELIREKVIRLTGQEVPHAVAVTIDSFQRSETKRMVNIEACIHVERNTQKGIIIGKGGSRLKMIGVSARKEIEQMVETKVFLKLFVRVQKNWRKDTRALRKFGI
ncbi:MAG: GTPase Era [Desulfobacterales bacterium]|nr:GTPase Era [Desulfobacterales bacterium]